MKRLGPWLHATTFADKDIRLLIADIRWCMESDNNEIAIETDKFSHYIKGAIEELDDIINQPIADLKKELEELKVKYADLETQYSKLRVQTDFNNS